MSKKSIVISLAVIVLIGAFLRFYKLGELSFVADEFLDINSSYSYFKTGEWKSWDFNSQTVNESNVYDARDERAWLYKWQVAQMFRFFPPTEGVARSVSALWGVLTIILMYFVGKSFGGKKEVGLISAFLFAVSISGIVFDRRLRMYAMFFPIFLLLSWLVFKAIDGACANRCKIAEMIRKKTGMNAGYAFLALVALAISMHVHLLTVNIIPAIILYALIMYALGVKRTGWGVNKYLVIVGAIVAGFGVAHSALPELTAKFFGVLKLFEDHYGYFGKVLADYSHPLLAFLLIALGSAYLMRRNGSRKEGIWLISVVLSILVMAVFFWKRNEGAQYIFFIQSHVIILLAAGIYAAADFLGRNVRFGKWSPAKIFFVAVFLALAIVPDYGYFFRENNAYGQNSRSESPNYRRIFDYVKNNGSPGDALVTRMFRSYYFSQAGFQVYDFGGERTKDRVTVEMIQEIMAGHESGWVVFSDNDETFVKKDAKEYLEQNAIRLNAIPVRGPVSVYRWEGEK